MRKISIAVVVAFTSLVCASSEAQNINVTAPFSTGSFSGNFGFNASRGSSRTSSTTTPSLTTQNGFGGSLFSGQVSPFVTGVVPVVGQGGGFFGPVPNYVELPSGPDNGVTRALQSGQLNSVQPRQDREFRPSAPVNYSAAQSTATRGDISVSAIKAERQRRIAAQNQIITDIITAAQQLEEERKFALARLKYREALSQTKDRQTKAKIHALIKATRLKD